MSLLFGCVVYLDVTLKLISLLEFLCIHKPEVFIIYPNKEPASNEGIISFQLPSKAKVADEPMKVPGI
jgi:hypothetical protein